MAKLWTVRWSFAALPPLEAERVASASSWLVESQPGNTLEVRDIARHEAQIIVQDSSTDEDIGIADDPPLAANSSNVMCAGLLMLFVPSSAV